MTKDEATKLVSAGLKHDFGTDEQAFVRAYAQHATVENMGHSVEEGIRFSPAVEPKHVFGMAYENLARDCEMEGVSIDGEFREWRNKYGPVTLQILKDGRQALTLENAVKVEKVTLAVVEKASKKKRAGRSRSR